MKEWARRSRGYLIVLPLALAVAFGWPGYRAWTGNDAVPHRPVDVQKGEEHKLGPITVKLVSVSVKQPQQKKPGSFDTNPDTPQDAVVVIAKFQGRIDNAKAAKELFCDANVEDPAGWKWESDLFNEPYVPENSAKNCDGERLGPDFKDIKPKPGEWYDFYNGYYVPKDKAKDLMPTLGHYKEYPHYLRFVS